MILFWSTILPPGPDWRWRPHVLPQLAIGRKPILSRIFCPASGPAAVSRAHRRFQTHRHTAAEGTGRHPEGPSAAPSLRPQLSSVAYGPVG